MTTSSTTRVRCENPRRLAKSLADRFADTATTEWDSEEGRGHVTWGDGAQAGMIAGDAVLLVYLECAAADVEKREAEIGQALGVEVTWTRRDGGSRG